MVEISLSGSGEGPGRQAGATRQLPPALARGKSLWAGAFQGICPGDVGARRVSCARSVRRARWVAQVTRAAAVHSGEGDLPDDLVRTSGLSARASSGPFAVAARVTGAFLSCLSWRKLPRRSGPK
jgi:hypothetical protein